MDEVDCCGSESQLQNCSHSSTHDCHHNEDASVLCQSGSDGYVYFIYRISTCQRVV